MANLCEICGKGNNSGASVSHSNKKTKRKWKGNIQKLKAMVDGRPKKVKVCTQCIKAGKIERAF
ncbi:50S ribosomal protein L28 [Natranaerobius thermophilus]|uniref:Large ribosomal subunit protein bL28 n=1 Tax=Natranaerobius thermophilus (strain ATCC BAA-1301 / DSM 18059 / JW/NM-WN-LF) TaxID=457570 RepID=RL28_NATTJ|nr:50S ribosomal protein L28 [Natranaerobius thermophilus]B2A2L1.1 RecName: Full=Large ribosomal subunit protein bL28; AltName: Full=50S ribosomal protein L28 [Natranaerobius thermophilus JW/NM-WN-LF]ACB84926.1 LSU ribosomal protein L28P [Natranaerobius thermophilus JW/NM-WN-LF]